MAIPGPSAIPPQMQPAAAGGGVGPSSYSSADIAFTVPEPIQATSEEVQDWLKTFTPFKPANSMPPEIGQEVLWRGFKYGRSGNQSTPVEFFNGTVREVKVEGNELYCYLT